MSKHTKTKIVLGSVVKAKVGELEMFTRKGRTSRMRKEVVGCVQSVVYKIKFLVLIEYGQKKEIGSCSLVYLNGKEEVDMKESITLSPKSKQAYR